MAKEPDVRWLETQDIAGEIHLCAVNSDNRCAAVCGFGAPGVKWQRATRMNRNYCQKCVALDKSGCELNFMMPNGTKVRVRERRAPR